MPGIPSKQQAAKGFHSVFRSLEGMRAWPFQPGQQPIILFPPQRPGRWLSFTSEACEAPRELLQGLPAGFVGPLVKDSGNDWGPGDGSRARFGRCRATLRQLGGSAAHAVCTGLPGQHRRLVGNGERESRARSLTWPFDLPRAPHLAQQCPWGLPDHFQRLRNRQEVMVVIGNIF